MRAAQTLCLLVLFLALRAGAAHGETVAYGGVTVPREAAHVDLGDTVIEDWEGFYAFLSALPNLQTVDLYATTVRAERIEETHQRFPQITFGMTMRFGGYTLRTDATAFSTLNTPSSPHLRDEDVSLLRYCTQLYALDLGHNKLTDLSFLYDLPELRVLIVAMNSLTDITPIGSLRHLEYLELFCNSVTDISCLAQLPWLMDLNLADNRIDSLAPLSGLRHLRRLWIFHFCQRPSADRAVQDVAGIRAALPDCEIDSVSGAIEGAWRQHPHYDVIHRIFQAGCYEPFADSQPENRPAGY